MFYDAIVAMERFVRGVAPSVGMPPNLADARPDLLVARVEDALSAMEGRPVERTECSGDALESLRQAVRALMRLSGAPAWFGYYGAQLALERRLQDASALWDGPTETGD